jgi:hypothetical protein
LASGFILSLLKFLIRTNKKILVPAFMPKQGRNFRGATLFPEKNSGSRLEMPTHFPRYNGRDPLQDTCLKIPLHALRSI